MLTRPTRSNNQLDLNCSLNQSLVQVSPPIETDCCELIGIQYAADNTLFLVDATKSPLVYDADRRRRPKRAEMNFDSPGKKVLRSLWLNQEYPTISDCSATACCFACPSKQTVFLYLIASFGWANSDECPGVLGTHCLFGRILHNQRPITIQTICPNNPSKLGGARFLLSNVIWRFGRELGLIPKGNET